MNYQEEVIFKKMSDKKIHFVSSDNKTAKEAKDNLVKRYNNYPASDADVIVALGGDGLMLQTLHDNINELNQYLESIEVQ